MPGSRQRRGWREEVWPKGTCPSKTRPGPRAGTTRSVRWSGYVRQQKRIRRLRFTALLHHIYNLETLRMAYLSLKKEAAPGMDGETWRHYGETLEENLQDLSHRLKRGAYRAKPVRRVYIPKADGRQRPLGVTTLEDKIVQRATVEGRSAECHLRSRLEEQSLQDLEPDELGNLLSSAGTRCLHSQKVWRPKDLGVPTGLRAITIPTPTSFFPVPHVSSCVPTGATDLLLNLARFVRTSRPCYVSGCTFVRPAQATSTP